MIPRHQPAYTWQQWRAARGDRRPLEALEAELGERLCQRLGRRYALFYQRGRDAFHAWFSRVASGRTAIVPAFTCRVVPEAICIAGNPLLFADVDQTTYNMEPQNLDTLAPPAGSVVVMTHQWGLPCRVDGILAWARANGAAVFEDCAAALGAEYEGRPCGSFGDVAAISFENTKLLGSGDLGVLLTDDEGVAARLREDQRTFPASEARIARRTALLKVINTRAIYRPIFRFWAWREGDYYGDHGVQHAHEETYYQRRPDRFALALVLAQWDAIEERMEHRRRLAAVYSEALGDAATCTTNPGARISPIRQPIRVADKRSFFEAMLRCGIDLGWSFAYTVVPDEQSADYPHAHEIAEHVLNLPIHEGVSLRAAREIARHAARIRSG